MLTSVPTRPRRSSAHYKPTPALPPLHAHFTTAQSTPHPSRPQSCEPHVEERVWYAGTDAETASRSGGLNDGNARKKKKQIKSDKRILGYCFQGSKRPSLQLGERYSLLLSLGWLLILVPTLLFGGVRGCGA